MHTMLRKIGNSRGVIIPSSIIQELRIEDEVEMSIHNGALLLKPSSVPRKGWFENYNPNEDVEPLSGMAELKSEQEDWEW